MQNNTHYQVVLCTCPDQATAQTLAQMLVEQKLAACVNIVPTVQSVYEWQGNIENDAEALLIIKTTQNGYPRLEQALQKQHPYDVPEIIALPVTQGNPDYLNWLAGSVA